MDLDTARYEQIQRIINTLESLHTINISRKIDKRFYNAIFQVFFLSLKGVKIFSERDCLEHFFSDKKSYLVLQLAIKKIFHCQAVVANGKCFSHEHGDMKNRFMMKAKIVLSAVLFLRLLQSGNKLLKTSAKKYMNSKISFYTGVSLKLGFTAVRLVITDGRRCVQRYFQNEMRSFLVLT